MIQTMVGRPVGLVDLDILLLLVFCLHNSMVCLYQVIGLVLVFMLDRIQLSLVMHSQLLARLKSESKYKTTEGGGVGARSLAHNTLRGRGVCWSSRMGLGRVDKLHSFTRACTQPTQSG